MPFAGRCMDLYCRSGRRGVPMRIRDRLILVLMIDNSVLLAHADGILVCDAPLPEGVSVAGDAEGGAYATTLGSSSVPLGPRMVHIGPACGSEDLFRLAFPPGDLAVLPDGSLFVID